MAKRKSRAARKEQRVKVGRAEAHGLPAPELPQVAKKAPRDSLVRDEFARRSPAAAGARAERVAAANQSKSGLPTIYKVLIGAAAAVGLVFGLSQLRKSDEVSGEGGPDQVLDSSQVSTSGLSQPVPDDAPVPVVDVASEPESADLPEDAKVDLAAISDDEVQAADTPAPSSSADSPSAPAASPTKLPSQAPVPTYAAGSTPQAAVTTASRPPTEVQAVEPKVVPPSEPKSPAVNQPVVLGPRSPTVNQPVTPRAPTTPQAAVTPTAPITPAASDSE